MTPQLWVLCQVQSHQHCWAQCWPCPMTGRHQLLRDEDHCSSSFEGAGDRGGSRNSPTGSSLCSSLLDITDVHPSTTAASRVALVAPGARLYFTFCCGSMLPVCLPGSAAATAERSQERGRTQEQTSPSSPPAGKPSEELEGKTSPVPWLPPLQLSDMSMNNPECPPVWLQWKERFFGSDKTAHPIDQKKWLFLNICHPALSW